MVPGDAATIVGDAELFDAALRQLDFDRPAACVKTVFQQLLEHGCRAINHLASGDLIDQDFREFVDRGHRLRRDGKAQLCRADAAPAQSSSAAISRSAMGNQ